MKLRNGRELKPCIGFALVKKVEADKTAGGLVLPEIAQVVKDGQGREQVQQGAMHLEIIESSPGLLIDGKIHEVPFKPGDRVVLAVGANGMAQQHWPPGVSLIRLADCVGYEVAPKQ